jgi:hypothetical protein
MPDILFSYYVTTILANNQRISKETLKKMYLFLRRIK